ncbi:MAG TPA: outer membrane protein transport protein [Polyangiaceae bacterium]
MHRLVSRAARTAVAVALLSTVTGRAHAGGLFWSDRGVRPMGRGGAFVAGADDLGAVWYNNAGIASAGSSFLFDATMMIYGADFTRRTQVIDSGGTVRTYQYPTVTGTPTPLPLPTIAGSLTIGDKKEWTLAAAIVTPYAPLTTWPETVNGTPAPQRYSTISLDGTALLDVGLYAAWKPSEHLSIGAGLHFLVGNFQSTVYLNANPNDRLLGAPEDPQYDTLAQIRAGVFSPTGSLGLIYEPIKELRFGVSGQLPYWINAPASVKLRLPTAAPFDNASVQDDSARVKFRLPAIVRAGVEVRPIPELRVEAAYVYESWGLHDTIDIISKGSLVNVTGFPSPFRIAPISLQRNFQDTHSVRLGGEYTVDLGGETKLDLRLGGAMETSAIPEAYVTALTIDGLKFYASVGAGLHVGPRWRFDVMYTHMIIPDIQVSPAEAGITAINPVRGYPAPAVAINGGTYSVHTDLIGLGLSYSFDPGPQDPPKPPPGKPKPAHTK